MVAPFELIEPRSGETPVIVEVPHASVLVDPVSIAHNMAPMNALARDADLYVDELMADATEVGASLLVATWSRYVLDLNRDADDFDGLAVVGGTQQNRPCGLLWRTTTRGDRALVAPVTKEEMERRLEMAYRPYHAELERLVESKRERFGLAVVLSMHSMPGPERSKVVSSGAAADVVIGTLGRSTAQHGLIGLVESHVRGHGWTVSHDDPYAGGATTRRLGNPHHGVNALQVELARRLYMDEQTLRKIPYAFALMKSFCRGLVAKIGAAALG